MKNTWFTQTTDDAGHIMAITGHTDERTARKEYRIRLRQGYPRLQLCEETDGGTRIRSEERERKGGERAMNANHTNTCDHGHDTTSETRLLPYGGGGNIITCYQHYLIELAWRRIRIASGVPYDLPAWDDLTPYRA